MMMMTMIMMMMMVVLMAEVVLLVVDVDMKVGEKAADIVQDSAQAEWTG
jgi:hypothetical protein